VKGSDVAARTVRRWGHLLAAVRALAPRASRRYEGAMRLALPAATLAVALALCAPSASDAAGRRTIEDDYPRALALARARGVPILVDVWAPW
jgi:hypothetical protein